MRVLNLLVGALLIALSPTAAHACAVCFGAENPRVTAAFYAGTGFLIFTVFSMLFCIVRYIVISERKKTELFRREGLMEEGETYSGRILH